ncbi:hypothetical protein CLU79DRAFT_750785 [Phycomyces nitens]|nr:hypothetical protein CLU79DRAFT_750785 [Phycomyces nitens]
MLSRICIRPNIQRVYWKVSNQVPLLNLSGQWRNPMSIYQTSNAIMRHKSKMTVDGKLLAKKLAKAIEKHDLDQAQAIYRDIIQSNGTINRTSIDSLLELVNRKTGSHNFKFIKQIIHDMRTKLKLKPNHYEYNILIHALGLYDNTNDAHQVFDQMRAKGLSPNIYSFNTLLGHYKRQNNVKKAIELLDEMKAMGIERNACTYNAIFHLLFRNNMMEQVQDFYRQMTAQRVSPNAYTYATLFRIANEAGDIEMGKGLYKRFWEQAKKKSAIEVDTVMMNELLLFKGSVSQDLSGMLDLYTSIPKLFPRVKLDTVSYNILLDSCLKLDSPANAYKIHREMIAAGWSPDEVTYGTIIDAEVRMRDLDGAIKLFKEMCTKGIKPTERIVSSLLSAAASKHNDPSSVQQVFKLVEKFSAATGLVLDTKAYNSLLSGLAKGGSSEQAQGLFDQVFVQKNNVPDIVTYTNLIVAYINDQRIEEAMEIYYSIRERHSIHHTHHISLDVNLYTILISSLAKAPATDNTPFTSNTSNTIIDYQVLDTEDLNSLHNSHPSLLAALTLFNDMRQLRIRPNAHCYTAILHACGQHKDMYILEQVHKLMKMDLYFDPDTAVYNALMDAYNRSGEGETVLQIWETLITSSSPTSIDPTTVSIVLDSCGHNGLGHHAKDIWKRLRDTDFALNSNNFNSYIECLCRSTRSRRGFDIARRVARQEMMPPLNPSLQPLVHSRQLKPEYTCKNIMKPRIEEKTINTLISFGKKKGVPETEIASLEAWKIELFGQT